MIAMIKMDWAEMKRIGGLSFATDSGGVNGNPAPCENLEDVFHTVEEESRGVGPQGFAFRITP